MQIQWYLFKLTSLTTLAFRQRPYFHFISTSTSRFISHLYKRPDQTSMDGTEVPDETSFAENLPPYMAPHQSTEKRKELAERHQQLEVEMGSDTAEAELKAYRERAEVIADTV